LAAPVSACSARMLPPKPRHVVRQHQDRRPAVAHEIARHGVHEVGVGAVHVGQEGIDHRHRDVGPAGAQLRAPALHVVVVGDGDPILLGTVGAPFVVGRGLAAGEGLPPLEPDLKLDDAPPFRLSRNHFIVEKRDGSYHVRDLCSTLGAIVNGESIGDHFRTDDALVRAGENEVIAGGVDSPFVFSVFIG